MNVVHANWSEGSLLLWAESLDACLRAASVPESAQVAAPGRGAPEAAVNGSDHGHAEEHPFAVAADELARALIATGRVTPAHFSATRAGDDDDAEADADADARDLRDAATLLRLRLPADARGPLPSDGLFAAARTNDEETPPALRPIAVPALRLRPDAVLPALLGLEDAGVSSVLEFGHDLRFWMDVARFVVEHVADQRFIPTLEQRRPGELRASWHPWLHDEVSLSRIAALLERMPPAVRSVIDEHGGSPWAILGDAIRGLTDAVVRRALIDDDFVETVRDRDAAADPHVAWLCGLLDDADEVETATPTDLLRDISRWIAVLDEGGEGRTMRLGFELREPEDAELAEEKGADGLVWRLGLVLLPPHAKEPAVEAEQLWRDPASLSIGSGGAHGAEDILLADLGRAARLYTPLESALSEASPTGIDLSTAAAASFLSEDAALLDESGFPVITPEWWGQSTAQLGVRLQIDAPPLEPQGGGGGGADAALLGLGSMVRYRWQVAVGDQALTADELRRLAGQKATLVRLRGRWVHLDPAQLREAVALFEDGTEGEMTLMEAVRLVHGGAAADGHALPVVGMDATGWVADLLGASSDENRMPRLVQPEAFKGTLRPYQEIGLSWLAFLDRFGLGACLADDMGLGKTIQLIALLLTERVDGPAPGPTLLVAPTSVVGNWRRELERFAPTLRVHIHHGPDRPVGEALIETALAHDVVVTTFSLISRDRDTLGRIHWHRVALDEAQYIKNPPTKQTATIRALKTSRRVALTGTPVENRLSELWSIMEFCNPGYLGGQGDFRRRFAIPIERHRDGDRAEQLRRLVRPFVLRRVKTDPTVIDDLPPCVITREFATLTTEQANLYEQAVSRMLGKVGRSEGIQRRGLVLAALVELKQICNHPLLAARKASHSDGASLLAGLDASEIASLSARSGKTHRLMEMLEEVLATGDRAIIFTQFRRMGHLLASMIQHDLDSDVMFMHGATPAAKREEMIDRFQDGKVPVFVLSLRAGGIGVNLTAANHVFHFDRWWNPAVENQATDRAFRIGQTRTVHVHKFVCTGTLEERIDRMIERKTELARNIVGSGEDWLTELSAGQLRDLLALRENAMDGMSDDAEAMAAGAEGEG